LRHIASLLNSELKDWISNKIAGQSGFKKEFWMNHELHKSTIQSLFNKDSDLDAIDTSTGITALNMARNYNIKTESSHGNKLPR